MQGVAFNTDRISQWAMGGFLFWVNGLGSEPIPPGAKGILRPCLDAG